MSNKTSFIKTGNEEYIKTHFVYDGSNRVTDTYEARANALNGHYALRTRFSYVGATTYVENTTEEDGVWDSSWDI